MYARISAVIPWIHEQLCLEAQNRNEPSSFCIGTMSVLPNGGGINNNINNNNNNNAGDDTSNANTNSNSQSQLNAVNPPGYGHTLRFDLQYDANPTQVAWILVETNEDRIVDNISYGQADIPNEEQSIIYENQPSGNYTFMVTDLGGDGICCDAGLGYFMISEVLDDGSTSLIWANDGTYKVGTYASFELTDATLVSVSRRQIDTMDSEASTNAAAAAAATTTATTTKSIKRLTPLD